MHSNDFEHQTDYVCGNARRLLGLQDRNPLSPSHGCFHYPYWRDKTSDVADIRYQEAGAALGLMTLPVFHREDLPPREELNAAFIAGAACWGRFQHRDGSFDEWYKGEHGFAATEFSLIAYGLALHFLGDRVATTDRETILRTARKAADWLLTHDDHVKTNHEAAAVAALALAYKLTGDERYKAGAESKRDMVLRGQNEEGWFNEVAGMDLGYCSLLLDYMMLYHRLLGDASVLPPMRRLFEFLHPFIKPDLTVLAEAGICLNPYVSRLGTILLSPYSAEAAELALRFDQSSAGFDGILPYLSDDLRLSRWAYLPLVTTLLALELKKDGTFAKARRREKPVFPRRVFFKRAGVFAYIDDGVHVTFAPAGGGAVGILVHDRAKGLWRKYEDHGYSYLARPDDATRLFTGGYSLTRSVALENDGISAELGFVPATFFYPPYIARVVLRLGCNIPSMSRLLRKGIDYYRRTKGTALNQSAAPVASGRTRLILRRRLRISEKSLRITDEISGESDDIELRPDSLAPLLAGNWAGTDVRKEAEGRTIRITKELEFAEAKQIAR